ncbi:hypothetical protein [Lichenibacterium dinghuense]|uniref:hypothetical protein n=1 Tax=Lichenibacterium dinghuense TaxID=2895977 RepID=UPI001F32CEA5|nr:hypothetical protein [Lichenibacterium sp. 6Y81]
MTDPALVQQLARLLAANGVRPDGAVPDVHERRLVADRDRKRRFRAAARASGEPVGHALDSLLIDGIALCLEGRSRTDPVTVAMLRGIGEALQLAGVAETPDLQRRLRSRLRVGARLRTRRDEAAVWAMEPDAITSR